MKKEMIKKIFSIFVMLSFLAVGLQAPEHKRSEKVKEDFLKMHGLKKVPPGYEIDHIIALADGGKDEVSNLRLLSKTDHKAKTAREAKARALRNKVVKVKQKAKGRSLRNKTARVKQKAKAKHQKSKATHTRSRRKKGLTILPEQELEKAPA